MTKYKLDFTTKFKKDYKKFLKKKNELEAIHKVIELLAVNGHLALNRKNKPHKLVGKYKGCFECHILPDLLLIWEEYEDINKISLIRLGSHSELFS